MCHRALLVTDFNKVWGEGGWGKSDSKAFGDYFVVSQRQKSIDSGDPSQRIRMRAGANLTAYRRGRNISQEKICSHFVIAIDK
jgi:hypothetical protein